MAALNSLHRQQLATRLQYEAQRLGWQGLVGIALIIASLVAGVGVALPRADRLQLQEGEAARLRTEMPQQRNQSIPRSPQAALDTFYALLPGEQAAARQLALLLAAATDHDLTLEKAEYSLSRSPVAHFMRYQITLPVRGSYVDIRKFSNQALHDLPTAALNDISFKRPNIDSSEVEARLRFTLYLRQEQP